MPYNKPARAGARRTRSIVLAALVALGAIVAVVVQRQSVGPPLVSSSSSPAFRVLAGRDHHNDPYQSRQRHLRTSTPATSSRPAARGEADGAVPDGVTVFDDEIFAVTNLDPDLLAALRRAATDAGEEGIQFLLNSGWRSPEYQERLLREAVSTYGSKEVAARWVATADTSPHVSGDAVDLRPSGAAWLSKHGAEYGLCQIYSNEPWHYELRPEARDRGCPRRYADPTHDPRMQQ